MTDYKWAPRCDKHPTLLFAGYCPRCRQEKKHVPSRKETLVPKETTPQERLRQAKADYVLALDEWQAASDRKRAAQHLFHIARDEYDQYMSEWRNTVSG